jgi:hypothetical protein
MTLGIGALTPIFTPNRKSAGFFLKARAGPWAGGRGCSPPAGGLERGGQRVTRRRSGRKMDSQPVLYPRTTGLRGDRLEASRAVSVVTGSGGPVERRRDTRTPPGYVFARQICDK